MSCLHAFLSRLMNELTSVAQEKKKLLTCFCFKKHLLLQAHLDCIMVKVFSIISCAVGKV